MSIFLSPSNRVAGLLRDGALALLYPQSCQVCGKVVESWRDGIACAACWQETLGGASNVCAKCGLRVPRHHSQGGAALVVTRCGRCEPLAFTAARACGRYDGALRACVLRLKIYPHLPERARELLQETFAHFPAHETIEGVVPVPLHPARLKERTFNQAEVIAEVISAAFALPVDRTSLVRAKPTERHRAGMNIEARAKSLEAAFAVRAPRLIQGRTLLVVDDTLTTGATADEIARTLLAGGAREVHVLTLTRAASVFDSAL